MKTAKTVTAGQVLPTSSLDLVLLPDPMAGLAKARLDPSTRPHTALQVEVVETFEAVATAAAVATVEALLVVLAMDSGRMVSMSQAHRT